MARDYRQQPIHVSEVDDEVVALCRQNQVQSNFVAKRLSSESPRHPIRSAHKNVLLSLGVMLFGIWHNRQSYRSTICCNRAWRSWQLSWPTPRPVEIYRCREPPIAKFNQVLRPESRILIVCDVTYDLGLALRSDGNGTSTCNCKQPADTW
jgi:hypothetical protein